MLELIKRASQFKKNTAIISADQSYTYGELLEQSAYVSAILLKRKADLNGMRVAFMVEPGFDYVRIQWGVWRAGGVAVPLHPASPFEAVEYILEQSGAEIIVVSPEFKEPFTTYCSEKGLVLYDMHDFQAREHQLPEVVKAQRTLSLLPDTLQCGHQYRH